MRFLGPRWATAVALTVALAGPPLFVVVPRRIFGEFPGVATQFLLQLVFCSLAVFVWLVVIRVERLPVASIGLRRPTASTVTSGLALGAASLYLLPLVTAPLVRALGHGGVDEEIRRLAALPLWFRMFVAITSGIVEETLYRGYAVERLAVLTGHVGLGAFIAALAFGVAHIPAWGIGFALGADLPFGVVMIAFYLWRRDLVANAIAHSTGLVVDLLSIAPDFTCMIR